MKIIRNITIVSEPASHEDPKNPGVLKKVLFRLGDLAAGNIQMINHATLLPKRSFNVHSHQDMQEVFLFVSGRVIMTIDNQDIEVESGDAVIVFPGEKHTMKNLRSREAEFYAIGIVPTIK
jgi:mannose-6-phosphate isomerase-like protein (cupin superfamily)